MADDRSGGEASSHEPSGEATFDDTPGGGTSVDVSEKSIAGRWYWLLIGQFGESGSEQIKAALVMIGIATAVLALAAATSALLADVQNWPAVVLLTVLGVFVTVFVWGIALGRLDEFFPDSS